MTGLFQLGDFVLHSGSRSCWKIDCDVLSDDDLGVLAVIAVERLTLFRPFGYVVGIPNGGLRLAGALSRYRTLGASRVLIVDDVLTTGASMREKRLDLSRNDVLGLVIFARTRAEPWVHRIFQMDVG